MNEQLNSAIAHLEVKYGWQIEKALGVYHVTMTVINCVPLFRQAQIEARLKEVSENVTDHQILALAKSAGWTGEEWEPKEDLCYAVCKEIREAFSYFSEWDLPIGFEDRLNQALAKAEVGS